MVVNLVYIGVEDSGAKVAPTRGSKLGFGADVSSGLPASARKAAGLRASFGWERAMGEISSRSSTGLNGPSGVVGLSDGWCMIFGRSSSYRVFLVVLLGRRPDAWK